MRYLTIGASVLNSLQECARKYNYSQNLELVPMNSSDSMEKGTLVHLGLEYYYKSRMEGLNVKAAMEIGVSQIENDGQVTIDPDVLSEVIKTFQDYCQYYSNDTWVPKAVEAPFSVRFWSKPDSDSEEGLTIIYEGKIDLVVDTPQGILIVDHKTSSKNVQPAMLSNQFIGYSWALREVYKGNPKFCVNKIVFNKQGDPTKKFHRYILSYTNEIIDEWLAATKYWCNYLSLSLAKDFYPPNYTSCDKYGGCTYRELCESIPSQRDYKMTALYKKSDGHDVFRKRKP